MLTVIYCTNYHYVSFVKLQVTQTLAMFMHMNKKLFRTILIAISWARLLGDPSRVT
jgi:hypothetical protein